MKKCYVLCAVLMFFQPIAAQELNFPLDTIAVNDLFNNRQFAAYDLNGKIHISYTGQVGTNGATREIYYRYQTANGFSDTINISSNAVDDNYSTLSIDNNNKVHIGFTGRDAGNLFQVKYTNNINGSFFTPVFLTSGGLNKATPYSKIGPDSVVHFVYFTFTNDPDNIYYLKHDLRTGLTSNPQLLVAGETGGDFDASLDVDRNGKVHVLVKSGSTFGGPLKYYSDISGSLIEYPLPVTANVTTAKIVTDRNNKVHITYRLESELRLYYTSNTSGSFSTPVVFTPAGQRPSGMQNIAVDDSLRVYVIYQSSVSASGKGFYLVYGQNGIFTDTMRVYEIPSQYVTRNSSAVIARGNGEIATFFTPGGVINSITLAHIFMKKGNLFQPVPVELTSFTFSQDEAGILLHWSTASETNNRGFDLEEKINGTWQTEAFIAGKGTTTSASQYSYRISSAGGNRIFRLKQIDYDGSFSYSPELTVLLTDIPFSSIIVETFPNPFNPETTIRVVLPAEALLKIGIYDVLGNKIGEIYNGKAEAGVHEIQWNAGGFNSGVYLVRTEGMYTANGIQFTRTVKKLILTK